MTNSAGNKKTTKKNANKVPRPNKSPIDEMIGSVDVNDKIKPTLDKMEAGTAIEKTFSLIVFLMAGRARSEEHTSEPQARGHLVCRPLPEKKEYAHQPHPP